MQLDQEKQLSKQGPEWEVSVLMRSKESNAKKFRRDFLWNPDEFL